ncbi:electron transfer flavoprotein subunit alpha/FixB family protein [Shewanella sp. VB17]|uniref:electron transfer flavoprotein subunit alpha/FixB family protein n=1 Tax=Shewanella sp. VB17 TaxID=2739432 RepID=UPI0015655070|nr:electron transfer flavoprotein subunit alpha/FixB family protein [Shewanella sp. VB17]NRD71940.1 electron transfer flavoprotein subunit alpha/FixB family protein [Shewanella sp. VB17]
MSQIIRRDPRLAQIQRNRLHPQYVLALPELNGIGVIGMGPTGLLRRSLHRLGSIGPNGIKRIDRLVKGQAHSSHRERHTAAIDLDQRLVHSVIKPDFYVVAVLDLIGGRVSSHDLDMLGLAQLLANENRTADTTVGAVLAVAFGELKQTPQELGFMGVDRLLHLGSAEDGGLEYRGFSPELRLAALVSVTQQYQPDYVLFANGVHGGGDLGRRYAARQQIRPAVGVIGLQGSGVLCRAAAGLSEFYCHTRSKVMLLEPECADAVSETSHEAIRVSLEYEPDIQPKILDLGAVAVDPASIPLAEAEFILSGGNGVEDWPLFHLTATRLGATEGASRVAVDDGFMPRNTQVGASGTWVNARVYIAVGISGAVQHLQGIAQCDKVIAINTDISCDMMKRAALSVVGDSSEVMSALLALPELQQNEVLDEAG